MSVAKAYSTATIDHGGKAAATGPDKAERQRARARTVRLSLLRRGLVGLILASGVVLTPLTTLWPGVDPLTRGLVIMLGTLLLGAGAALRLWAGLYIGGHKERELVTGGPYSLVRNPLYLGNLLAAAGIGLLTGSPLVLALTFGATLVVYIATIRSEEHKLTPIFGADYRAYLREVPALLPRPAALRRLIHDTTPCIITHRSLARELTRCLGLAALGLVALLLTVAAPLLQAHLSALL